MLNTGNRKTYIKIAVCILIAASVIISARYDYFIYDTTIATVTSVSSSDAGAKTGYKGEYVERYYDQDITAEIRNGDLKGRTVRISHTYSSSGVYDTDYKKGDDIFVEQIKEDGSDLTGLVTGTKRDHFVIAAVTILTALFLLIGGKDGVLTTVSLVLNLATFYFVLLLYIKGINMVLLSIPMVIIFTALLLVFMYGTRNTTWLALAATLISVFIIGIISALIIHFSHKIDYDFMEFLIQPYEQWDADCIFLSEILIGCMGAVTDVVVTIIITVDQIVTTKPDVSTRSLLRSCRTVGDDIVGSMIPVMFFTNVAAGIPFFILSMRNGITVSNILRYNVFFETARFLTGSIAVVIAIPVSTAVALFYWRRKGLEKC